MNNEIKCPYCERLIESNVKKCPYCGEYFVERTIPIQINSLGWFIVFSILTCGIYPLIWLFINLPKFDLMAISSKDRLKLIIPTFLITLLFIPIVAALFIMSYYIGVHQIKSFLVLSYVISGYVLVPIICAGIVLYYIITYRMLRIIEKFTFNEYKVNIYHNDVCWILFGFLYVIYFIYSYNRRVC